MQASSVGRDPIAIIGIGCRFPGALGPGAFWDLLREGRDPVTEVPADRWDADALYDPDPATAGKMVTRWGGFLPDVDRFDAAFFGLSPREANHVDPQQRLMLEVSWEALEDAGLPPFALEGSSTGVFFSVLSTDYATDLFTAYADRIDAYSGTGTTRSLIAARIAYFLDLRGPNLTVDTACSGSLTAINLAAESLRKGDSTLALAGGVNLLLRPDGNLFFSKAGALAPDGRCKPFDARANGIVRSDGAGVVVLKPLSRALADGDRVYALVLGGAINQDGRSAGVMAPNGEAQEALLRSAYADAGVPLDRVQYVEAHGTGTTLGDPVEARALGQVLRPGRPPEQVCVLGSVKSNLGHTESAAGIAGVIKVALAMHHRTLPGTVHFRSPNPMIPFADLGLEVRREAGPWPIPEEPLVAGVSSFGIGGTNAHVVMGEAPEPAADGWSGDPRVQVLPLSARHGGSLGRLAAAYRDLLAADGAPPLAQVCRAAALHRAHLEQRLSVVAASTEEARQKLEAFAAGEPAAGVASARVPTDRRPRLAMVLSGQGTHWVGMGRRLLDTEPVFADTLRRCDEILGDLAGWSLLDELAAGAADSRLDDTAVAQPAICAVQCGLAALWRAWGVVPDVVVGQSLGEVAAAWIAGALTLEDALKVVHHRSRLMQRVAGRGATGVVALPAEQTRLVLTGYGGRLAVAGHSSPQTTVVSGEREALDQLLAALEPQGIFARALRGVDVAFHSPQMDPLAEELAALLTDLEPRPAAVPMISTVTATEVQGETLDGGYWARNLRQPFRFAEAVAALAAGGYDAFLEVGPHAVVGGAVRQVLQQAEAEALVLASLRRDEEDARALYETLGELHVHGYGVDWRAVHPQPAPRVTLPTYPWHGQRFWLDQLRDGEPAPAAGVAARGAGGHPLLGFHVEPAHPVGQHLWERDLSLRSLHWLGEHRIRGIAVLPGVAHLEMARRAAEELFGPHPVEIGEVVFETPVVLPEDGGAVRLQFVVDEAGGEDARFQLFSRPAGDDGGPWIRNSSGRLRRADAGDGSPPEPRRVDLEAARRSCHEPVPVADFYRELEEDHGFVYGPTFRGITDMQWRPGEVVAQVGLDAGSRSQKGDFWVHPGLFDSTLQSSAQALKGSPTLLPAELRRVRIHRPVEEAAWCHATIVDDGPAADGSRRADIVLCDAEGRAAVEVEGLLLRRLSRRGAAGSLLHRLRWAPRELEAAPTATARRGWWIVLADAGGVADALEGMLEAGGEWCFQVRRADGYSVAGHRVTLDATDPEQFKRLLRECAEGPSQPCRGIVDLWGLDLGAELDDASTPAALDAALAMGTSPLLWLIQALGEADWHRLIDTAAQGAWQGLPRLWTVTRGAQAVEPGDAVAVAQAPVWGLARVALREHPELWGGLVDLDPAGDAAAAATVLHGELQAADGEHGVAYRADRRFALRLEAGGGATDGGAVVFRPDAGYLITGGLGALGLVTARWMAERGARRLILAGRSPLPPRREWAGLADDHPAAEKVAAVRELEAAGVTVHPLSLDVADAGALAVFLDDYDREGWPPIRGVVHAAGVLADGMLARTSAEDLETVWRAKIHGAWNLHRAFRDRPLDHFVLYSSVASVLGTFGQGNYAAGNAFLDALAHERRRAGLPALSLNWGPWAQVGMAARTDPASMQAQSGIRMLSPAEGTGCLGRVLAGREAQVVAARVDWAAWAEAMEGAPARRLVERVVEAPPSDDGGGEEAASRAVWSEEIAALDDPAARRERVEARLLELCAAVSRIDPAQLDLHLPLPSLGFDSILTAEIRGQIRTHFGVEISLAGMLLGASLARVSEMVLAALDGAGSDVGSDAAPVPEQAQVVTAGERELAVN